MTYATQQDLITRVGEQELIQLTDRADPPAGSVDAAVVAAALGHADALIDSLVGARYPVPLAVVPSIVIDYACDIARYRLYGDAPTETVQRRYDQAVRYLHDIQAGRADLAGPAIATSGGGVQHSAADRVFTRDTLSDY